MIYYYTVHQMIFRIKLAYDAHLVAQERIKQDIHILKIKNTFK